MTVGCSYCGKALRRDNARFCSQCGMPLSPSSSLPKQESSDAIAPWLERVLHEQIAQQPFSSSQSQLSNHTIPIALQSPSPITPIPISLADDFAEEINTPMPKKPSSIVVVRENTPRPITLALTPLPEVERPEAQIEYVKPANAQLASLL